MAELPLTLPEWLDDLTVRFLLNLPPSELSSVPRLCFQVEEAQWFYEDFVRPAVAAAGAPPLPALPLRQFCLLLFQHCPLFNGFTDAQHLAAYEEFLAYKVRVPVRGAIMLNEKMDKLVLVRGWKKGASWSFPRGKINKDEKDLVCAIREVYEETGYDLEKAGLVPEDEDEAKYIDITMREQHMRLFVFRGVPEDTYFEPRTRKEIGKISWYDLKDMPGFKKQKQHQGRTTDGETTSTNKFYMVAPFLGPLKKWINDQRRRSHSTSMKAAKNETNWQTVTEDEGEGGEGHIAEPEVAFDTRSEDLRRLLNLNGPTITTASQAEPRSAVSNDQAADLLAMLQGGQGAVSNGSLQAQHVPFDSASGSFAPQMAVSHDLRRPSLPKYQHPPLPQHPVFALQHSPFQAQSNYDGSAHATSAPGGSAQNRYTSVSGMNPEQMPANVSQSATGPMAFGLAHDPTHHSVTGFPIYNHANSSMQYRFPPQLPPSAHTNQGSQGAIAQGPPVPSASQLPAPRLNPHTTNLLNAFKSDTKPVPSTTAGDDIVRRAASVQQTALLDLFKKPTCPDLSTSPSRAAEGPQKSLPPPAVQDESRSSIAVPVARPTLSEITRTLPPRVKAKSPPALEQVGPVSSSQTNGQGPQVLGNGQVVSSQPKPINAEHGEIHKEAPQLPVDKSVPSKTRPIDGRCLAGLMFAFTGHLPTLSRTNAHDLVRRNGGRLDSPVTHDTSYVVVGKGASKQTLETIKKYDLKILNEQGLLELVSRLSGGRGDLEASPRRAAHQALQNVQDAATPQSPRAASTEKRSNSPNPVSNGTTLARKVDVTPMKILSRPGSSAKARPNLTASATVTPAASSPSFQPQVLKRPKVDNSDAASSTANVLATDKRDRLLSLFGKPTDSPATVPAQSPTAATQPSSSTSTVRTVPLSQTINSTSPPFERTSIPATPPAPVLKPERSPSYQSTDDNSSGTTTTNPRAPSRQQQNLLLDLFSKQQPALNPRSAASPKTPISPFALGTPAVATGFPLPPTSPAGLKRSSTGSGVGTPTTPAEHKEFLMGYLNAVVRNEGQR